MTLANNSLGTSFMPKKIWDEKDLLPKVLELRKMGLSYREIAREIGCSTYTVWKIIKGSKHEKVREETRSTEVDELVKKIRELEVRIEKIEEGFRMIKEISEELSNTIKELLSNIVKGFSGLSYLIANLKLLMIGGELRIREGGLCIHVDEKGYCSYWFWRKKLEGYDMKEVIESGERRYYLNVKKHYSICITCPYYRPRTISWP